MAAFFVAGELGVRACVVQLRIGFEVLRGAGAGALGFHFTVEAFFIQIDTQFARHVGGQVVGEAVGVVEFEDVFAANNKFAVGDVVHQIGIQGFGKRLFRVGNMGGFQSSLQIDIHAFVQAA